MTVPDRGDDREPKQCPRCRNWCLYDGWDHVHAYGIGIGSCTPAADPAAEEDERCSCDEWSGAMCDDHAEVVSRSAAAPPVTEPGLREALAEIETMWTDLLAADERGEFGDKCDHDPCRICSVMVDMQSILLRLRPLAALPAPGTAGDEGERT